jgi:hypothetical protein
MDRMLELGPGGGANVVEFFKIFKSIVVADISIPTLEECYKVAMDTIRGQERGFSTFLLDVDYPETLQGTGKFDFFLCTAVVQHMPTAEWAEDIFSIIAGEMRPGAQAMVQFRTKRGAGTRHKNPGQPYERNVARWLLFQPEDFFALLDRAGWRLLDRTDDGRSGYMYTYLEVK